MDAASRNRTQVTRIYFMVALCNKYVYIYIAYSVIMTDITTDTRQEFSPYLEGEAEEEKDNIKIFRPPTNNVVQRILCLVNGTDDRGRNERLSVEHSCHQFLSGLSSVDCGCSSMFSNAC